MSDHDSYNEYNIKSLIYEFKTRRANLTNNPHSGRLSLDDIDTQILRKLDRDLLASIQPLVNILKLPSVMVC